MSEMEKELLELPTMTSDSVYVDHHIDYISIEGFYGVAEVRDAGLKTLRAEIDRRLAIIEKYQAT